MSSETYLLNMQHDENRIPSKCVAPKRTRLRNVFVFERTIWRVEFIGEKNLSNENVGEVLRVGKIRFSCCGPFYKEGTMCSFEKVSYFLSTKNRYGWCTIERI